MAQRVEVPRSDRPRVSFLVIAARKRDPLERSLRAIARTAAGTPSEVVLALNDATPEVAELARSGQEGAIVVESPVSLGFAGGLNLAREAASGEYLAVVHDDSEVSEDWLGTVLGRAEAEPLIGSVGGRVLSPEGEVQTAGVLLCRDGLALPLNPEVVPSVDLDRRRYVDFVSCSAALIRAEAWDGAGGADEAYFPSFYVDADVGMSLRAAGWVVAYEPAALSKHAREHRDYPGPLLFVNRRNQECLARKWERELADYAPPEIGPDRPAAGSPQEVEGALERCRRRAEAIVERAAPVRGTRPVPLDPRERERAHLGYAVEMWREYSASLERDLERWEQDRARMAEAVRDSLGGTPG